MAKDQSKLDTMALNKASARIKGAGLKSSGPRLAILSFLMREHGPFILDEIHRSV